MKNDNFYMNLALELAKREKGITHPNPTVAAVLVKNGKIIGKGVHKGAGKPHAEIEAINDAQKKGASPKGATMYVTLEPCCHYGRTPPCTNAIIEHNIKRVVIGTKDPNPTVAGKGIKLLQEKGITVKTGVLEEYAKQLNEDFFTYITQKRPFVHLKIAQTLDGKIASYTGSSKWITNEKSRKYAHKLRKEAGAVLVGINTVLKDNSKLTVRHVETDKQPKKIIIDKELKIPLQADLLSTEGESIIITSEYADKEKIKKLKDKGIKIEKLPVKEGLFEIEDLLNLLFELEIVQILVEGGAKTITKFLKSGFVDRFSIFIAPKILGEEGLSSIGKLDIEDIKDSYKFYVEKLKRFDDDIYLSLKPSKR
ncbi:MAG: bifunctional diaminohydroxyphosphoribosylaminopyrimidine deaminase/5-amino-6-(5-phosphoribosylamino)uracil reductase RibD [Aquificae bacterium]|nr:bifunctional diaminohydroxyphosphoribosylaminopyrimidine deaminase/5-amino-6-(5-phosphoribosylamino)uracil reductase RibD [Aquificota bacterium]